MAVRPFRPVGVISGFAVAVAEIVVRQDQVDIPLLHVLRGLADISMPADRDDARHAALDICRNVKNRGVCKSGKTFESEPFDSITVALDGSVPGQLQIPLRRNQIVDA